MSELNQWLTGVVVGSMASFLYFWGLWITVHRLKEALNPVGMYTTSLVLRLTILGIAMAFVFNGDWRQVVAAAVAFVLVRFAVMYLLCRTVVPTVQPQTVETGR